MQMHELLSLNKKDRKRVGRGGCRGTTSGRGSKGQKARSGSSVDPLFEGGRSSLFKRMKKNRGFRSPHAAKRAVSLARIEATFSAGATISLDTLVQTGILRASQKAQGAKIVATGKLTKNVTIAGDLALSAAAENAVKAAGGTIATAA